MTALRLDNIAIVVNDLQPTIDFFLELGLAVEGKATVEGDLVDRLVDLQGVRCEIVMMKTPDGQSRLELTKYLHPPAVPGTPDTPVNTLGIRRMMFNVDDIDAMVARLQTRGGRLLGEIVQYENSYRLAYVRGPESVMIALAQPLG